MAAPEEFDASALQSQISLSLSVARDLTASWLPKRRAGSKSAPAEKRREEEVLARRPERLGLGASLPSSASSASASSTADARLKGRLTGGKRKGPSDEAPSHSPAAGSEESEEEGSRFAALKGKGKGKTRASDGFAGKKKQKLLAKHARGGDPAPGVGPPAADPPTPKAVGVQKDPLEQAREKEVMSAPVPPGGFYGAAPPPEPSSPSSDSEERDEMPPKHAAPAKTLPKPRGDVLNLTPVEPSKAAGGGQGAGKKRKRKKKKRKLTGGAGVDGGAAQG